MTDAYKLGDWMIHMIETVFKPLFCEIRCFVYTWTTPTVYALMFTVKNQPRRAGYAVFTCIMYNVKCSILALWNRKGTQWATWGLIWYLWVSKGLKWTHFEWPYFAVAKLGLNWSQSVSFWVATTKLHPQRAQWSHSEWLHTAKAKKYSVGLNRSHFEWPL